MKIIIFSKKISQPLEDDNLIENVFERLYILVGDLIYNHSIYYENY